MTFKDGTHGSFRRGSQALLRVATVVLGFVLLAGYSGALHPIGDSFAVFRFQVIGALALLCTMAAGFRLWRWVVAGGIAVLVAGVPLFWAVCSEGTPGSLRLYQKNMLFNNEDLAGLQADIRRAAPAAVTLQEVSAANEAMLSALSDAYPHQLLCPFGPVGGVAVLTRLPQIGGEVRCGKGMAAMHVQGPETSFWLVSVHLHWPWPYRQAEQLATLLPELADLDGAVVVAGDFNMVPWSAALAQVRSAARAQGATPLRASRAGFGGAVPLFIDQVLAPGGGHLEMRPELGSDHRGIVADLRLEPDR